MNLADNPFFVLGVAAEASRIEIEREAQKLLGMLELGFAEVATYATPLGPRPRTAAMGCAARWAGGRRCTPCPTSCCSGCARRRSTRAAATAPYATCCGRRSPA